jgi:type IV fimbrial biogenesis protein FimT
MNRQIKLMRKQTGFTLIELMIVIVIMGITLALGIPSYTTWIANTQIRTGAESLFNGLNLARTEAIRRNESVQFRFDPAFKSTWAVCQQDAPATPTFINCAPNPATPMGLNVLHARFDQQGSNNVQIGTANAMGAVGTALGAGLGVGATAVTFDGLGRVQTAAANAVRIDVLNPKLPPAEMRRLVLQISLSGQVRTCDPDPGLSSTDPRRCT